MKKLIAIAAVFVLIPAAGTTAFAAGPCHNSHHRANSSSGVGYCSFVDADGDGICDNGDAHCTFTDTDGDGLCDNGDTHCTFTDADGDGICDNCQNKNTHSGTVCANGCTRIAAGGHRAGHHGGRHH